MNNDKHVADLKRLANEAGIVLVLCVRDDLTDMEEWRCETEELARFAALVRADALEQAIRECEADAFADQWAGLTEAEKRIRALKDAP